MCSIYPEYRTFHVRYFSSGPIEAILHFHTRPNRKKIQYSEKCNQIKQKKEYNLSIRSKINQSLKEMARIVIYLPSPTVFRVRRRNLLSQLGSWLTPLPCPRLGSVCLVQVSPSVFPLLGRRPEFRNRFPFVQGLVEYAVG